jgi:hypothetical protein
MTTAVLVAIIVVLIIVGVILNQLSYVQGIWDGAFHQDNPDVRRHMRDYDAAKAWKILGPPKADEVDDPTTIYLHRWEPPPGKKEGEP